MSLFSLALSLVVYFLPRKMATLDQDVIAFAVGNEEYKKSTWFNEPHSFARSERRCLRVVQRGCDQTHDQTVRALENVISLIVGEENSYRFGFYKQWEADFLRHLLGYTTAEEEKVFNDTTQRNYDLCTVNHSLQMKMGKRFTALLRHNSPLKPHMYSNGTVELQKLFEYCYNDVNPTVQFEHGRQFAAFLNGNNKQRYFLEVNVNDAWFLNKDRLP